MGKFVISDSDPFSPSAKRGVFGYDNSSSEGAQTSRESVNNNEVSSGESSPSNRGSSTSESTSCDAIAEPQGQAGGVEVAVVGRCGEAGAETSQRADVSRNEESSSSADLDFLSVRGFDGDVA